MPHLTAKISVQHSQTNRVFLISCSKLSVEKKKNNNNRL